MSIESIVSNDRCNCDKPSYVNTISSLIWIVCPCQIVFFLVNFLRLCRQKYRLVYLDDIQLRLIAVVSALFSLIFLIVILVQQTTHRFDEPLAFFETMHRHYSRLQIYTLSNDIEFIRQHIQTHIDVRLGLAYLSMIFVLILTLIGLLASSMIDMKILPKFDDNNYSRSSEKMSRMSNLVEHSISSEPMQFTRQTRV
jgi:hypothetical protein